MAWGEIAQAALGVAGALFDERQNTRNLNKSFDEGARNREFQAEQAGIDRQMAREFAENGIRMRVNDAVAAGLHPLVGAGVTPISYSPVSVGGGGSGGGYHTSSTGQDISRAIQATLTKDEREVDKLKLDLLRSQIAETDARAGYYDSMAGRSKQTQVLSGPFPAGAGQVTVQPDVKISQDVTDPSRTAGKDHPFFKRYQILPGMTIDVPYSQDGPAEGLEGTGALAATIMRNAVFRPMEWWNERGKKNAAESWKFMDEYDPYKRLMRKKKGGEE